MWKFVHKHVERPVLKSLQGDIVAGIQAYDLDLLISQKIALIPERLEGRDIFDLYVGLQRKAPSWEAMRIAARSKGLSLDEMLKVGSKSD